MSISGRKFAITGASRGLGAALAIVMADRGARLVLLARNNRMLKGIADTIHARTGQSVDVQQCDLSNTESCAEAGRVLARDHADLDGLIHNGAMWLPGSLADIVDAEI